MILLLAAQLLSLDPQPELATVLPILDDLRAGDTQQSGGSCPPNAPLLCDNRYCCPQEHPYCCPGQECGATSSCGAGGGDDGAGDGGGGCGPGEDACDGGCCPPGSVCGAPGTGQCCPSTAPHHCPSDGTCGSDPSDPCGHGSDGDGASSNSDGDGGGDGDAGGGGAGSCPADASGYPGLPADIQVWSQCATACSYCGVGNEEGVNGSCTILEAWNPEFEAGCPYCAMDCSTPSGDRGDPESVSTENDAFGGCAVGSGRLGGGFGVAPLLLLLIAGRRRRPQR